MGWTVTGTTRDRHLAARESRWESIVLDLADQSSIEGAARHVREAYPRLDALISSAGHALTGPWEELTIEELRAQLEASLIGTMTLCRACLPMLRAAEGVLVQVSSVHGQVGGAMAGAYNAAKFGLEGSSEALAAEVAPQGVRVVIIEPGPFRTPILDRSPFSAGRGSTGLYDEAWKSEDEWKDWFRDGAEDPREAVDAIVAAATMPGAPLRIPVGTIAGPMIRAHAQAVIADVYRAETFLQRFRSRR